MSTTAKIDFEPGLFDEGRPGAAPDLPTVRLKRWPNRTALVVAGGLLLVLAVVLIAPNTTAELKPFPAIIAEGQQRPVRAILTPAPGVGGTPTLQKAAVGDSEAFCVGQRGHVRHQHDRQAGRNAGQAGRCAAPWAGQALPCKGVG